MLRWHRKVIFSKKDMEIKFGNNHWEMIIFLWIIKLSQFKFKIILLNNQDQIVHTALNLDKNITQNNPCGQYTNTSKQTMIKSVTLYILWIQRVIKKI